MHLAECSLARSRHWHEGSYHGAKLCMYQVRKKDLFVKSVQRTVIWMGKKQESVEDVPCGNTVAMVGLDHQFITKNATLTNEKEVEKFCVSPVVRVAVQCNLIPWWCVQ